MTNTTDISKPYREIAELFWEFHRARLDDPSLGEMKPYIQPIVDLIDRAKIDGMKEAKSRVLRRTEIPKDAREPTRDAIVILGEEIADIIQRDIDALSNTTGAKAGVIDETMQG